jgi:hypothetical protein
VLDAVARVLQLSGDERSHLYTLAHVGKPDPAEMNPPTEAVDRRIRRLIDALGDTPAILHGPFVDVVLANEAACFLLADFNAMPAAERNAVRWILLSPEARELYGDDWESAAGEMVGMLRLDAGQSPDHPRVTEIVRELTEKSPLFRRLWKEHRVSTWLHARKVLHHPSAGTVELFNEGASIQCAPEQTLYVMMPGEPAAFDAAFKKFWVSADLTPVASRSA